MLAISHPCASMVFPLGLEQQSLGGGDSRQGGMGATAQQAVPCGLAGHCKLAVQAAVVIAYKRNMA
ncbi:hypothetical protein CH063_00459 [Colletotrichum higginsianum]|uniref:Uncharacterized protein n=1 Tax=Colletotrichum higginsianum (strain IMI 349063) TaxID=759273 RepID=H1VSG0_COLHI|nr:hypothetical protein CH63R_00960 [Colletotrichum higginsianum IMI 349063]OBR15780.1 hypothetical protein CH63R_00960 [Colletotrichum higginsianum IMI 349063]CCF43168.1 hypothetical protein CH063_00459 [Colletotrichum higginsianum]